MDFKNKHRGILYASIFSILSVAGGYALRYFVNLILAQHLRATIYGDFAFIVSIVFFISMSLLLGMDEAALKFIPEYIAHKQWGEIAGFVKKNFHSLIARSFIVFLLGLLLTAFLVFLTYHGYYDATKYYQYSVTICLAPIVAILSFQAKLLRSFHSLFWSLVTYNVLPFLLFAIGIMLAINFNNNIALHHAIFIFILAAVIVTIIQKAVIDKTYPQKLKSVKPEYLSKEWNSVGISLLVAEVVFTGINAIDILMLKFLGKNLAEVGIFAATTNICGVLMILSIAINIGLAPFVSVNIKKYFHDKKKLQRFINNCNLILTIPTVLLSILIAIFGHQILHAFGPEFVAGYWVLIIVLVSQAIYVLLGISFTILRYTEHQQAIVDSNILTLLLMVSIEALLVTHYGYYGAAIGLAFSRIMMGIWFLFVVRKEFGIKPFFII